jgi:hypothetical protein
MTDAKFKKSRKRKLLALLALLPWTSVYSKILQSNNPSELQQRFKDMGAVLVVDAVASAVLEYVKIYDDRGIEIYSSGVVSRKVRKVLALSSTYIPLTVRVNWRTGAGWDNIRKVWNEGTVAGDYVIPVAERIPDQVLNHIRARGGNLRLKFRLKPDGVLFGWDIERVALLGNVSIFEMPGGDFLETQY